MMRSPVAVLALTLITIAPAAYAGIVAPKKPSDEVTLAANASDRTQSAFTIPTGAPVPSNGNVLTSNALPNNPVKSGTALCIYSAGTGTLITNFTFLHGFLAKDN